MATFKLHKVGDDGWSEKIAPIMNGYKMACCDCGLVHDMEFFIVKVTKNNPDGTWDYKELESEKYRVMFKAKRNIRSTSAKRRNRKVA